MARLKKVKPLSERAMAYWIGLLSTQGIIYAFKVGNTYINIELMVGLVAFVLLTLKHSGEMIGQIKKMDTTIKAYLLSILISFFAVLIYFLQDRSIKVQSYFNGLVMLMLSIMIYYSVILLRKYQMAVIKGIWHGLIINVVVSALQYIFFQRGSYFTFNDLFPQNGFYISIPWTVAQTKSYDPHWLIYSYRAQGMFLEASYFVSALTTIILLLASFEFKRNSFSKTIITIIAVFLSLISSSGNFVVLTFGILVYWFVTRERTGLTRKQFVFYMVLFYLALGCAFFVFGQEGKDFSIGTLTNSLLESFDGVKVSSGGNQTRVAFMLAAMKLFLKNPLGVGYNMSSTVLKSVGSTYATFSYVLTVLLEQGVIGLIAYIYLIFSHINRLRIIKNKKSKGLAVAIFVTWIFQVVNGTGFTYLFWILLAFAKIEMNKADSIFKEEQIE